jgi:hypothetical protein
LPPSPVLAQDHNNDVIQTHEIARTGDGQLKQRVLAVYQTVLLGDVTPAVIYSATAQA